MKNNNKKKKRVKVVIKNSVQTKTFSLIPKINMKINQKKIKLNQFTI